MSDEGLDLEEEELEVPTAAKHNERTGNFHRKLNNLQDNELVRREDHEEALEEAVEKARQRERRRILNELRDLEKDLQEENYEDRVIWGVAKEDQRKTAISALKEFKDSIVDIEKTIYINGEPVVPEELEEEVEEQ